MPTFKFDKALVRLPAASVAHGLRAVDRGNPDVDLFRSEHEQYCNALIGAGLAVLRLPPMDEYPDSVFVEDPALILPEVAVLLPAAAESRRGEAEHLADMLSRYRPLVRIQEGFVDGGDILVAGRKVFVGLSSRTNRQGCSALARILDPFGYQTSAVDLPADLLHLKTGCALLDDETILVTETLAETGVFSGFRTIIVPPGEEAAANALRINESVLVSAGHPETADLLRRKRYRVGVVPTGQAEKLDGGLSCMSLRF